MSKQLHESIFWGIDDNNNLIFWPTDYIEGLFEYSDEGTFPWQDNTFNTIKFNGNITTGSEFRYVFCNTKINTLDLSNIDLSHVKDMTGTFANTTIGTLVLGENDLSNVEDITGLFNKCKINKLDLSSCNFHNVKIMLFAFAKATIDELILPSLPNVTCASNIFDEATINSLTISPNSFEKLKYISNGFYKSTIKELNIPTIYLPDLQMGPSMFRKSNISNLDLSNFHFRDNAYLWGAFSGIKTHKLKLNLISDSKIDLNLVHAFTDSEIDYLDLSDIDFRDYLEVNLTNCFSQTKCENVVVKSENDYNILRKHMEEIID